MYKLIVYIEFRISFLSKSFLLRLELLINETLIRRARAVYTHRSDNLNYRPLKHVGI